ncbi:DNA polymerase III subunit delta' [Thiomicrorhabdus sediminis]|nr:DNA polymerase III subunit delta' [Thiomicrorhabdus sediminis]
MLTSENLYPWLQPVWQRWQQMQTRLGHAYLLSGPKGIGVEQFVELAVMSLMCQNGSQACGNCANCHLLETHQHPDYFVLRRLEEKKEITVDQVRELIYKLNETSHQGGYKITWVDGVEYLNQSAFNAILKNLEEPAANTLFILTTHQIERLPATIKSRCQLIGLQAPALADAQNWIHQQAPQADAALIKRALRLNWGTPVNALQWIENSRFEQDNQWKNDLKQLQSGRKLPSQVIGDWLKWPEPESVFDYFYQWTVGAIRSVMYQSDAPTDDSQQANVQNWLRFQQAVLTAQQYWQGNANKELLLESLCMEWLQIQQSQAPLQSVFKSKIQRGQLA